MNRPLSSSLARDRSQPLGPARILALAAGVLLPLLTGCPGSLEGGMFPQMGAGGSTGSGGMTGSGGGGAVCDAPGTVFATQCYFCHGAGGVPQAPDLMTPPFGTTLASMNSVSAQSTCAGMPFLNKANPSASVILKRVTGSTCGPLMPLGATSPDAVLAACVMSWVMGQQ